MSSFTYFVLGVLISVPIAIAAPFIATALQRRLATRSERQGRLRIETLERDYATTRNYHDNPMQLLSYMGMRILLLLIFWIAQSIVDVIFGFSVNSFYAVADTGLNSLGTFNISAAAAWVSAAESLTDVIILTLIFRSGLRAYRLIKRVINFDQYQTAIQGELDTIRSKDHFETREESAPVPASPSKSKVVTPQVGQSDGAVAAGHDPPLQ